MSALGQPALAIGPSRGARLRAAAAELAGAGFARKVAGTLGTRAGLIVISLIINVLVARSLEPEGRGLYAVTIAVALIGVHVVSLGLHATNTWVVSRDPKLLPSLIANSVLASLVIGSAGALIAWLVLTARPGLIDLPPDLLALGLVGVPIGLLFMLAQHLMLGIGRIREYNAIDLAVRGVTVAALVAFILTGVLDSTLAVLAWLLGICLGAAGCLMVLVQGSDGAVRPRLGLLRTNAPYGLKAYAAGLLSFLVMRFDLLMVQHFLGATDAGHYSIAVTMAEQLFAIPAVIGVLLVPRLSSMVDESHRWWIGSRMALVVGVAMAGMSVVATLLATPVITILFGRDYLPAEPAFVWLLPGIVMLSASAILMSYGAAIGNPAAVWIAPLMGFVASLVLNVLLIPALGIVGASISSTWAFGMMLVVGLVGLRRGGAPSPSIAAPWRRANKAPATSASPADSVDHHLSQVGSGEPDQIGVGPHGRGVDS